MKEEPSSPPTVEAATTSNSLKDESQRETDELIGTQIAKKYRIVERLGRGAMGTVYKAEHSYMNRLVALKVLHEHLANDEESIRRFSGEARTASKLSHPHAVTLYDFGIDGARPYLVMKYVQGETLKSLLAREKPLTLERACLFLKQICGALQQAHSLGIIHRDLKPENIMVTQRSDGTEWLEVLDFGIAKVLHREDEANSSVVTQTGVVIGTPQYMSPEQALGKQLDHTADIYSIGVIAYEMLSGTVPFRSKSMMEMLMQQINDPPEPLRQRAPDLSIPKSLDAVVLRALEKEGEKRFLSAEEFFYEFSQAVEQGDSISFFQSRSKQSTAVALVLFLLAPLLGYGALEFSSITQNMLSAPQELSQLYISSTPEGAKISLNGKFQDKVTPLLITDLDPGSYLVTLTQDGYTPLSHTLEISAGQNYSMTFPLETTQAPASSTLGTPPLQARIQDARREEQEERALEEKKRRAKEAAELRRAELAKELALAAEAAEKERIARALKEAEKEAQAKRLAAAQAAEEMERKRKERQERIAKQIAEEEKRRAAAKIVVKQSTPPSPPPEQIVKSTAVPQNTLAEARKLIEEGQHKIAIPRLQRYLKTSRNDAEAYTLLGTAYLNTKKSATYALKEFQTAFRLRPQDAETRFNLALAFARLGRREDALNNLSEALLRQPGLRDRAATHPAFKYYRSVPRFKEIIAGK